MKCALLLITAIYTISQGNCSENLGFDSSEKVYVQPNQISINEHGIFVYVGNQWFATDALHMDESGVYAGGIQDLCTWKCRHCGTVNSAFSGYCANKNCRKPHERK